MKFKFMSLCCLLLATSLCFTACNEEEKEEITPPTETTDPDDNTDPDNPPAEGTDPDDSDPNNPPAGGTDPDDSDPNNPPAGGTDSDDDPEPDTPTGNLIGTNLYAEPYLNWWASKSMVKSYMNGYTLYGEEPTQLIYTGKYRETLIMYQFEGTLESVSVAFRPIDASLSTLHNALQNRYTYITTTTSNGITMRLYSYEAKNAIVALASYSSAGTAINMVIYMEDTTGSGKPATRGTVEELDNDRLIRMAEEMLHTAESLMQ